jgi:2-oxoglutarate ferredoxin oxidoreductase subunit beta
VYGLTKGQFSASADIGSTTKRGEANHLQPIDPIMLGLSIGATFLARGFSGDKRQLVPIFRAAMAHRGLAIIDVISPCVTFNDHEGSTKSYLFTRQHDVQMTVTDFVPPAEEISATIPAEGVVSIPMHDGATLRFRSVPDGYDPTDRMAVMEHLMASRGRGEIVTGLLYIDEQSSDLHELGNTTATPLTQVPYEQLTPGSAALAGIGFR